MQRLACEKQEKNRKRKLQFESRKVRKISTFAKSIYCTKSEIVWGCFWREKEEDILHDREEQRMSCIGQQTRAID